MQLKILFIFLCIALVVVNYCMFALSKDADRQSDDSGVKYYMNPGDNSLTVLENEGDKSRSGGISIFLDNKDYTPLVKQLVGHRILTFGCGKILIFGGRQTQLNTDNDKWICPEGRVFIPLDSNILIISGTDIQYFEDNTPRVSMKVDRFWEYDKANRVLTEKGSQKGTNVNVDLN